MTMRADREPGRDAGFLLLMPRIEAHVRWRFRGRGPDARDEAIAEAVAYGLIAYRRLVARGKDPAAFPAAFARFAALAVINGRGVARGRPRDVQSPAARHRGVVVRTIHGPSTWWRDLAEARRADIPEQAAFNLDVPAWLARLPRAKRRAAKLLAHGHGTTAVARATRVTLGRVSQLRRELARSWAAFHADR